MARRPNPNLVDLWRDRTRRQETSGLSANQFCRRECCAISAFYRWKQRLLLFGSPAQPRAIPASSSFLLVTVRLLDQVRCELLPIEADLPNGVMVQREMEFPGCVVSYR